MFSFYLIQLLNSGDQKYLTTALDFNASAKVTLDFIQYI